MKYTLLVFSFFALVFNLQAQNIPIDFESDAITYTWNDFAGGVATVIDNPDASGINTSSKVSQMVKFDGEVFGGSTLTLDGEIDFGDNTAISMKVWANRVGAPVLFKLEGPTPVEVNVPTTVANEWEELVFDFSGLTGATYTGITIIYDLGVVGDGSADFTLYFDDMVYSMGDGIVRPNLPIDFESDEIEYIWGDFGGGVATVIDNPDASGINTSAKVSEMVKFEGEVFGGSTLAIGGVLDFGDNTAISMKVWANRIGAPVLFKLEGPTPVEVEVPTTVANEWEELTFDFTGLTGGVYTGITIIYDLGTAGDGSADFTLYFDDMQYSTGDGVVRPMLPIDFESDEIEYVWSDFGGGVGSVIDNPDASGINTSAKVGQMVKLAGEVFGGSTLALGGALDFGDNTAISMKVWANRVGGPVLLKLEGPVPVEIAVPTTVANEWEELVFDFTGLTGGTYTGITLIYDLGVAGDGSADFTFYFDDIQYGMGEGIERPTLPLGFESDEIEYVWADFAGGVATIIDNPDASGINVSAKVGQMIKFAGETFGGSTIALGEAIDFGVNNSIAMKVWANRVGAPVLLKLEGPVPVEVSMPTTVANQWEELVFDFTGLTDGTYTGVTIIYDLGVVGDGGADFTLYFDDVEVVDPLSIRNFAELEIEMYPNPVANILNLEAKSPIDQAIVYDLLGRRVLDFHSQQAITTLDVTNLAPGTYVLRVRTGGEEAVTKFVKR